MLVYPHNIVFLGTFVNNSSLVASLDSQDGLMSEMPLAITYISFEPIVRKQLWEVKILCCRVASLYKFITLQHFPPMVPCMPFP